MTDDPQDKAQIAPSEAYFGDPDRRIGYNRAWFNLIRAHRRLYPRLTKILKAEGLRDPIWAEILYHISLSGPEGQRMAELEDRLFVPQYALSRHVARMEADGLLARRFIAEGRRKQLLSLTPEGRGIQGRIWHAYEAAIRAELEQELSIEQAYELAFLLTRLLRP